MPGPARGDPRAAKSKAVVCHSDMHKHDGDKLSLARICLLARHEWRAPSAF